MTKQTKKLEGTKLPPKVDRQLKAISRHVLPLMDLATKGPLPLEHAWGVILTPLILQAQKSGLKLKTVRSLCLEIERTERWAKRTMMKVAKEEGKAR